MFIDRYRPEYVENEEKRKVEEEKENDDKQSSRVSRIMRQGKHKDYIINRRRRSSIALFYKANTLITLAERKSDTQIVFSLFFFSSFAYFCGLHRPDYIIDPLDYLFDLIDIELNRLV
jgi:hypothetical protein